MNVQFPANLGSFGIGNGLAWTSPTLPDLTGSCYPSCDHPEPISTGQASWVSCFFPIGGLLAGILCGFMIGIFGRRFTLILMTFPFAFGWIILTLAGSIGLTNVWWFYIGRFFTGKLIFCLSVQVMFTFLYLQDLELGHFP